MTEGPSVSTCVIDVSEMQLFWCGDLGIVHLMFSWVLWSTQRLLTCGEMLAFVISKLVLSCVIRFSINKCGVICSSVLLYVGFWNMVNFAGFSFIYVSHGSVATYVLTYVATLWWYGGVLT